MTQQTGLETVIGGGNPEQADGHYRAGVQFEKDGMRYEAIEELRKARSCGASTEQKFYLAYLLNEKNKNIYAKYPTKKLLECMKELWPSAV